MAFLGSLKLQYTFSTNIFITAEVYYTYCHAEGIQKQSDGDIDNLIISEQTSVSFGAGYSFSL